MQKKNRNQPQPSHSSDWEQNIKKEAQKETMKKIAMWGAIALATLAGLAALVFMAQRTGTSNTELVVNENVRDLDPNRDIVIGNPNAEVTLVNYSDFQCPACAGYNSTMKQIENAYPEQVAVVYRIFPIDSIHPNAQISGQAAWAAWQMDKFSEMKDELYNNQSSWENLDDPRDEFIRYATSIGLDEEQFSELMNSDAAEEFVNENRNEAVGLGLNSTPTFFLNKKQISVSGFDSFKELIDLELSGQQVEATTAPLQ